MSVSLPEIQMFRSTLFQICLVGIGIVSAFPAHADVGTCSLIPARREGQVPAARIVSTDSASTITSTFCDGSAGYTSDVYLTDPEYQYIATGHVTPQGNVVDLGFFAAGEELIFSIYVRNTGYTYYSGPGERNPDGQVHAAVTDLGGGNYVVGFEDLYGGGDRDYDDINIVINAEIVVLEPCASSGGDTDDDGVCDNDDNCPDIENVLQDDSDGDGEGDVCDACIDIDADGACDDTDNCPGLANDQADTDFDGTGDACDSCQDVDGDSACDDVDNCVGLTNDQADADGDGFGDACDACAYDADNDADDDGYCADEDNCSSVANEDQADYDFDDLGDSCDVCPVDPENDADADSWCANEDNCSDESNEDQADTDGDGAGDVCDVCPLDPDDDADGDGYCANEDSCPDLANSDQEDSDDDGVGNACDDCPYDAENDADGDGLCGDIDFCADTVLPDTVPTVRLGTNRFADINGDGIFDTTGASGRGPRRSYTIEQTGGCSCAQIIEELALGYGHTQFGCSISAMDDWTLYISTN